MEDRIKLLIQLLNNIDTKGQENLNNLLASIQLATGLLQDLQNGGSQND